MGGAVFGSRRSRAATDASSLALGNTGDLDLFTKRGAMDSKTASRIRTAIGAELVNINDWAVRCNSVRKRTCAGHSGSEAGGRFDEGRRGRKTDRSPSNAADSSAGSPRFQGRSPSGGGKSRPGVGLKAGRGTERAADSKAASTSALANQECHTQYRRPRQSS